MEAVCIEPLRSEGCCIRLDALARWVGLGVERGLGVRLEEISSHVQLRVQLGGDGAHSLLERSQQCKNCLQFLDGLCRVLIEPQRDALLITKPLRAHGQACI